MKKVFIMCTCLLLLCGCSSQKDKLSAVQNQYTELTEQLITYDVTCDFGAVITYSCEYSLSPEDEKCTVRAPVEVSGVCARIGESGTSVEFDGMSLVTYTPNIAGFSPVDCIFYLLNDIKNAQPSSYVFDKKNAVLTYENKYTSKIVTLDPETYAITGAELFVEGDMVLNIVVK